MISKRFAIPLAAVAIIGSAGAFGINYASADSSGSPDGQAGLVDKLASALHVDKSKVQAVFDQDRTEREQTMEASYEQRLTQAVTDGKLTNAQKDLVLAKHKELKAKMEAARTSDNSSSDTDRRTAMKQMRTDIDAWASQNGIDAKWLMPAMGPGGHGHGPGGRGLNGAPPDDADLSSTN